MSIAYGELVRHFDDDEYRFHASVTVDLNDMTADADEHGAYWDPDDDLASLRSDECWDKIVLDDGTSYPAVSELDVDGVEHMLDRYGYDGFVTWRECD